MKQLNQIFTFYDSADKQEWKAANAFNDVCKTALICPNNKLLHFQIRRPYDSNPSVITSFKIYCHDGGGETDLLALGATFKYYSNADYIYVVYEGNEDLSSTLACGTYYAVITDDTYTFYSRAFKIANFSLDVNDNIVTYNDEGQGISLGDYSLTNLIVNGTFDTDLSGWSTVTGGGSTLTWSAGSALYTGVDKITTTGQLTQSSVFEIGEEYKIKIDTTFNTTHPSTYIEVYCGSNFKTIVSDSTTTSHDFDLVCADNTNLIIKYYDSGATGVNTIAVDNIESYLKQTQILIF